MQIEICLALFLQASLLGSLGALSSPPIDAPDVKVVLTPNNLGLDDFKNYAPITDNDFNNHDALPAQYPDNILDDISIDKTGVDYFTPAVQDLGDPLANPDDGTFGVNAADGNLTGGVVYTRWGRSSCPTGSELVYAGTAAGTYYDHSSRPGGATNYLCLPSQPIYDEIYASTSTYRAYLYSSEYRTSSAPSRLRGVNYHTPNCAVCSAPSGRTNALMVPGRNVCPSGKWRLEYNGYLMAERYTSMRTKFICMDRYMEAEPGTQGSQGGSYFYMVESRCIAGGGLPCGPYVNGYELTCAVCTI